MVIDGAVAAAEACGVAGAAVDHAVVEMTSCKGAVLHRAQLTAGAIAEPAIVGVAAVENAVVEMASGYGAALHSTDGDLRLPAAAADPLPVVFAVGVAAVGALLRIVGSIVSGAVIAAGGPAAAVSAAAMSSPVSVGQNGAGQQQGQDEAQRPNSEQTFEVVHNNPSMRLPALYSSPLYHSP